MYFSAVSILICKSAIVFINLSTTFCVLLWKAKKCFASQVLWADHKMSFNQMIYGVIYIFI